MAKTIIFARNHAHATFIEERFNRHYPGYAGHFARVIDNYATYPQSLLDDFSRKDRAPHIAISVDMLDTGVDVPEVANLVFFKPVWSRIKFWQMIGRGTRLCPDLFGPGEDKRDFRVFDFCFNFDFFREQPEGIEPGGGVPLGARLFRSRVRLLANVQTVPDLDPEAALAGALTTALHQEVAAMNRENFIVRMQLEAVERFQRRESWERLTASDVEVLQRDVAGLPSEIEADDIESRLFDLTALKMQLAFAEGDTGAFERHRRRVVEIAMLLEEKSAIPAVAAQLAYLASVRESAFWEGIALDGLEKLRMRLRGLAPFLDRKTRPIVYTDFRDEITAVREDAAVYLPKMTGVEYERKVQEYLRNHLDHIVIHRLRTNQPLTATDLRGLEQTLVEIGEDDGRMLLTGLLARSDAPLPRPFRAEHGGDGPRRRAGGLLGVPLHPKPDHAADPLHRDGDRPAHGAGRHGAVRALRGAVQQRARRRPRGVVRRKEQRDRGDLREAEGPSARAAGRRRLRVTGSGDAEGLSVAEAKATNHRQREHPASAV